MHGNGSEHQGSNDVCPLLVDQDYVVIKGRGSLHDVNFTVWSWKDSLFIWILLISNENNIEIYVVIVEVYHLPADVKNMIYGVNEGFIYMKRAI